MQLPWYCHAAPFSLPLHPSSLPLSPLLLNGLSLPSIFLLHLLSTNQLHSLLPSSAFATHLFLNFVTRPWSPPPPPTIPPSPCIRCCWCDRSRYIQDKCCQREVGARHSVHSTNLHCVSPVASGIVRRVLVSAWTGDGAGGGRAGAALPPGLADVLVNAVRSLRRRVAPACWVAAP